MSAPDRPSVWLVDPISYSGMAYSDVGQIAALRELGADALLIGSGGWMLEPAIVPRASLFRGTHGSGSRLRRGLRYLASLMRLVDRVRRWRPDVVHWQFTEVPAADLLAMAAIRILGVPQVYTAHELLPWSARRHHRWLFRVLYRVVDAIVVHSDDQASELIRHFAADPRKVHVAPLGDYVLFAAPGLPQAEARARLGLPEGRPIALFFGTIRPSKGLEVLLDAWRQVAEERSDAILLVIGKPYKGLDTGAIVGRLRRLGIERSVRTRFEHVDPAETNLYYRAADLVVLPYHEIGTSGVLRYAYDSARPVIATSVGEHATHVIPGETGRLVPPRDPDALARALVAALSDRPMLVTTGATALRYATAEFGWRGPAERMLSIYRDLGRDRRPRRGSDRNGSGGSAERSSTRR